MSDRMDDWTARAVERHAEEVARGKHDSECEWAVGFRLCHCSKRDRERRGLVNLPEPGLVVPPPDCTSCYRALEWEGDEWVCHTCHIAWDSDGDPYWTDDHGDISPCAEHGIRAHLACQRRGHV